MTDQILQQPQVNIEDFSRKSQEFYNGIKAKLEAESLNKYVALDYQTSKYWLGDTASDALGKAKAEFPKKIFYLIQVGSPTSFSVQSITSDAALEKRGIYGFSWAYR